MNYKHIREEHKVRVYSNDGENWTDTIAFGAKFKPEIIEWLKLNTVDPKWIVDFNGSGNGCCDPEDDYAEIIFVSEQDAVKFMNYFNNFKGVG